MEDGLSSTSIRRTTHRAARLNRVRSDNFEAFTDAGAKVIGISSDSVESHKAFAQKHNLPFTLLADTDSAVRKQFGVSKTLGLLPGRVTYVIDPDGIVRKVFSSQFKPKKHIDEALAVITKS